MALPADFDATWTDVSAGSPTYNSAELRRADGALAGGAGDTAAPAKVRGGIVRHASNSLAVTVDASDVVTIKAGAVVIPQDQATGGGVFRCGSPADVTGSLTARHATNSRIDLVIFRALDPDVVGSHAARTGRIEIVAGDPAGSPVAPTLPKLAVELARITVPADGGGTATVDSTQRLYFAAPGGTVVCTSSTRPAHVEGLCIYETDTDKMLVSDGAAWSVFSATNWQTFAPTWTTTSGSAPSIGNGVLSGRYRQIGNTVQFRIWLSMGSTSSGGENDWRWALPVAAKSGFGEQAVTVKMFAQNGNYFGVGLIADGGSVVAILMPTSATDNKAQFGRNSTAPAAVGTGIPTIAGQFTLVNGSNIVIEGTYEAA